ncbi:lytic transglycosylase domain-containing protein [Sinirhodobacter populi]|uniref:Lytic transglycosylase domain-containing protein n=1 Tax=Paenirhodobacter populi TaxID=2306993 RepID=A0A443K8F5_9RHOB|nr:lytic transglycosylase domain-containing protein [Sinirhodobacter populi]
MRGSVWLGCLVSGALTLGLCPGARAEIMDAAAEEIAPQPVVLNLSPKRVAPPAAGAKRLTIQIDPEEQRRGLAAADARRASTGVIRGGVIHGGVIRGPAAAVPGAAPSASYAWFWQLVSPALAERDGRFERAIEALAGSPQARAPRLSHLQEIARRHGRDILSASIGTRVSPALVLAVISTESAGRADAVSRAGAVGLMQLIPATATRFAVDDSTDPAKNIRGGVAYLDWLMREFDGDPLMVIAAYNAGENAVRRNGGVPPYAETRDYVPKVLAAWQVARGLCATPPELVSDACVFVADAL